MPWQTVRSDYLPTQKWTVVEPSTPLFATAANPIQILWTATGLSGFALDLGYWYPTLASYVFSRRLYIRASQAEVWVDGRIGSPTIWANGTMATKLQFINPTPTLLIRRWV